MRGAEDKGRQQGLTEGRQQGLTEGLEKGRRMEKIQMAKNLLSIGLSADQIVKVTGLSLHDIENLR
jgi:predicted transposase/invertase (TIGR01784 family)